MPYFKIAHSYKERKEIVKFWEEMRKKAESIRDEHDKIYEQKYRDFDKL